MIKILLSGCNGKMGQVVTHILDMNNEFKIIAGYDMKGSKKNPYPVFTNLQDIQIDFDVILDFSNPEALDKLLEFAVYKKTPIVIATTGLTQKHMKTLGEASTQIPVFLSANMSLGINLLIDLVKKAATILEGDFDIEIIEKHHNQKIDAPSGTALAIADAVNSVAKADYKYAYDRHARRQKRDKNEMGIHSLRGGTIVGEHSVIFAGNDEIIEIKHTAMSRAIFAEGALKAVKFVSAQKPGLYSMGDLIS